MEPSAQFFRRQHAATAPTLASALLLLVAPVLHCQPGVYRARKRPRTNPKHAPRRGGEPDPRK
eukprot:8766096-Alexandrium_andersonii.AAC.1